MERREFIGRVSLAAIASTWAFAARGQQPDRVRRIGVLMNLAEGDPEGQAYLAAFQKRVGDLGWLEGSNIRFDYRRTAGSPDRARAFAKELIGTKPDVILVSGGTALSAIMQETRSVPIVFVALVDPVAAGFVSSLARPGGNATGFTGFEPTIGAKWLEMLKEIAPGIRHAVILTSDNPISAVVLPLVEAAVPSFGLRSTVAHVHDAAEIERAIDASAGETNVGLLVLAGSVGIVHRDLIIALAARHRLPAIYTEAVFSRSGGLISFGYDCVDNFRHAASYVDRILRGEKTSDLPVQGPTKFELIVNLKTAKTLDIEISPTLLARADEVIE
jgi:putative tryptophan/tyrosine transport system substrate-binding protein